MRVRAILLDDSGHVILFRRTRPGREPYYAAPGGHVEPGDAGLEAALRRELLEELAIEAELLGPALRQDDEVFMRCRLARRLPIQPTAAEFGDSLMGTYEEQAIPIVRRELRSLDILPERLKAYLIERSRLPSLGDGRVRLGGFRPDDIETIIAADRDPEHARWFDAPAGWTLPRDRALAGLERWPEDWRLRRRLRFAVREAETDVLLGGCEIQLRSGGRVSLAYWTYAEHRGRGYATRAVRLVAEFCFSELPVSRVQILVDVENAASRAVALKAGFAREGVLRGFGLLAGHRRDMVLFARLARDA